MNYQCPSCFSKSHSAHTLSFGPTHVVQQRSTDCVTQVSAQIAREARPRNSISGTRRPPGPASSGPAGEPALAVHHGVICDSCNKTVVGVRHKCLDCPSMSDDSPGTFLSDPSPDYDLCAACVKSGATEQHNPFHEFFDIETPGRVYVHTVLGDDRDRSLGNRQQLPSSNHASITRQEPVATPADLLVRHSATCNLCDSAIVGERYVSLRAVSQLLGLNFVCQKCVVCSGEASSADCNKFMLIQPDFDTCSSCFRFAFPRTCNGDQQSNHLIVFQG